MSLSEQRSDSVLPAWVLRLLPAGDTALGDNELLFGELFEALPAAVYTTDTEGRITYFNEAAADLWGCRPELGKNEWCGSWRLYWPDGRPMRHDECPMAVALKEGRPIRGAEAAGERPDGTRVPFLAYPTPLRDRSGALTGAVNTLIDITERKRTELFEQRLASIVKSSDDAILSADLYDIIRTWNPGAERLFGYMAEEVIGKPLTFYIPMDRQDEESDILSRIRRGECIDPYETVRQRKDGSLVEISLTVSSLKNAEDRIIGVSTIARDITERRRAQEQQNLLLREMSHRVKNLFAVASGLVTLSARSARTPADMAQAVRERLGALARAHGLTRPGLVDGDGRPSQDTTLHALVQTIFAPYVDPKRIKGHGFYIVTGPSLPVGGNAVTSIALVMHELATNAAKYGALSSPGG
ncbi:MAG: PAS domain S-box protein, partial [Methylocella sp.]